MKENETMLALQVHRRLEILACGCRKCVIGFVSLVSCFRYFVFSLLSLVMNEFSVSVSDSKGISEDHGCDIRTFQFLKIKS